MTDSQTIPDDIRDTAKHIAEQPWLTRAERDRMAEQIAKAIHDAVMVERPKLQPIATAPNRERVMVAGWNNATKTVQGYWWWHEDVIVDGKAFEHPEATHWFPILKPEFPATPKARG
jgi:hypothetical protein